MTDTKEPINKVIADHLISQGWQMRDPLGDMAESARFPDALRKTYQTAVGPKDALVLITPAHGGHVHVQGTYESEGRNVLEPYGFAVGSEYPRDNLIERLDQFLSRAEKRIEESYARKLHIGVSEDASADSEDEPGMGM